MHNSSSKKALRIALCIVAGSVFQAGCFWEGQSGIDAAAFDFFSETGPGDAGGLSEDRAETPGAFCQNSTDQALFADPDIDVNSAVAGCGGQCFQEEGDLGECTTLCLVTATGLSEPCARCFGEDTVCTANNCLMVCMDPSAPDCQTCRDTHCTEAFELCAG